MRVQPASAMGMGIRARRQGLGWDPQRLAEKAGVGRQRVVAIERGKPRTALGLVLRTLTALELRVLIDDGRHSPAQAPKPAGSNIDELVERARQPRAAAEPPRHRTRRKPS